MQALIAQPDATTIAPMTDATMTDATTTAVTIGIATVIGQKDPSLVKIATAGQTTSSPPLMNLAPSVTTMSSTRRSSMAHAPCTKTPNTK